MGIDCLIAEFEAVKNFVKDVRPISYWSIAWVGSYSVDDDPADNADDIEDSQQTLQLPGLEETQAAADIEDSQLPGLEEAHDWLPGLGLKDYSDCGTRCC